MINEDMWIVLIHIQNGEEWNCTIENANSYDEAYTILDEQIVHWSKVYNVELEINRHGNFVMCKDGQFFMKIKIQQLIDQRL